MNVKDTSELIGLLKEVQDEAAQVRNAYMEEESKDPDLNEHFKKTASKAGMRASLCGHFIRLLEEIEVTR